jgi:glutamine synthetase
VGEKMDGKNAKALAEKEKCGLMDVKFSDLLGLLQHFTVPVDALSFTEKDFFPFDGSSIRGFQEIDESDMYLVPDYSTVFVDPFSSKSISVICDVYDPVKKEYYPKDCRFIAKKAEKYLKSTGIADVAYFGPEPEFFIFDEIRYDQNEFSGYYFIDSAEGIWNSGKVDENGGKNLGYRPRYKEGYFPAPPHDSLHEIRNDIVLTMQKIGITVEKHHHEVATAGQCEVGVKYDSLTKMADKIIIYKYIVKNVARKHGKVATFMPKPLFNDNGSGMHTHQSLWKDGKNIFAGDDYAGLSETALYYIGGLLKHARALAAIISPTTNSYKRLVTGFEAPVNLTYSYRNRSAAVRIPVVEEGESSAVRIEYRPPDPSCNPYLAFAAMLMAGIDGIKKKIHPGDAVDENIYKLSKEKATKIAKLPGSLEEALKELENDHEFLLEGGVFTKDVLETWIEYKKTKEIDSIRLRPHPWEYYLYHDI